MLRLGLLFSALLTASPLLAEGGAVRVEPGALKDVIAGGEEILRLAPGRHEGSLIVDRPLTIECESGAIIDGGARGSVIAVTAPDVTIRGCRIEGSGSDHQEIDSAVRLLKGADRALIADNVMIGNLYGVDIHGAKDARVSGNVIEGRQDHRVNDRGNGVYVWNAPGAVVEGNDIRWGRDGIFVNTSKRNVFRGNRFRDLRFAVHYMYADDSEVAENISIGNDLGYAVMYSTRVRVVGNVSIDDAQHGVMLNYANESEVAGNLVQGGGDRCLFMYNAHKNRVLDNRFERCAIGVHFTAGSERNRIAGNAFIGNRTQVKYVSTGWLDWSAEGRGNYWSDFVSYDIDADGIADALYRPNDGMDHVLWTQPAAKLLMGSPAIQLARWAQSSFPALLPGGVVDTSPLMRPVEIEIPDWEGAHVN